MAKLRYMTLLLILVFDLGASSYGACPKPNWTSGKEVVRKGKVVTVVCMGEGATDELSELDARNRCNARVANEFISSIDVKDTSVFQDKDAAQNREVANRSCVVGLVCLKPSIKTCASDGSSETWRRCEFDLTQAREGTKAECAAEEVGTEKSGKDAVANRDDLTGIKQKVQVRDGGRHQRGQGYVLTMSVTPPCDDVLVVGSASRRVKCSSNPLQLPVKGDDREVIVRAKGYMPKTITLDASGAESQVDVYLDAAD